MELTESIFFSWFLILVLRIMQIAAFTSGIREYCQLETFTAKCGADEVIVMDTSFYGRMKMGRCVKGDLGFMGCSKDVIEVMDRKCSGRQSCQVKVPNEHLEVTKPCYEELKSYLEASYHCQKVLMVESQVCNTCEHLKVHSPEGYIASLVTEKTGCGSDYCPWIIEADPGQKVNLTLIDFTPQAEGSVPYWHSLLSPNLDCKESIQYAYLKEKGGVSDLPICRSKEKESHIFTSSSHSVTVSLTNNGKGDQQGFFLLKFEVTGCPDLKPKRGEWFQRVSDDEAKIGCTSSDEVWKLTCQSYEWRGNSGNCSDDAEQGSPHVMLGSLSLSHGVAVLIIIIVATIVGLFILLAGIICWKWSRRPPQEEDTPTLQRTKQSYPQYMQSNYSHSTMHYAEQPELFSKNDYAHIWERPLPQQPQEVMPMLCAADSQKTHIICDCTPSGDRDQDYFASTPVSDTYNKSTASKGSQPRYFELERPNRDFV